MIPIFDFDYCTKEDLYRAVDEVRRILNVQSDFNRVDIRNLIASLDWLDVEFMDLPSKRIRGATNPKNGFIILNSNRNHLEQRFDFAHEFFHVILHRYKDDALFFSCLEDELHINNDKIYEWQANEAAAELLIPYKKFVPEFIDFFELCSDIYQYEIAIGYFADTYEVSRSVIEYRIESLSYEIYQYECGKNINEIEILSKTKQIQRGIKVPSYHNRFNPDGTKKAP